jgi:hypothetical protein
MSLTLPPHDEAKRWAAMHHRERMSAERLADALRAYGAAYPCPGFALGDGEVSGCRCPGLGSDCPTCEALGEAFARAKTHEED